VHTEPGQRLGHVTGMPLSTDYMEISCTPKLTYIRLGLLELFENVSSIRLFFETQCIG